MWDSGKRMRQGSDVAFGRKRQGRGRDSDRPVDGARQNVARLAHAPKRDAVAAADVANGGEQGALPVSARATQAWIGIAGQSPHCLALCPGANVRFLSPRSYALQPRSSSRRMPAVHRPHPCKRPLPHCTGGAVSVGFAGADYSSAARRPLSQGAAFRVPAGSASPVGCDRLRSGSSRRSGRSDRSGSAAPNRGSSALPAGCRRPRAPAGRAKH